MLEPVLQIKSYNDTFLVAGWRKINNWAWNTSKVVSPLPLADRRGQNRSLYVCNNTNLVSGMNLLCLLFKNVIASVMRKSWGIALWELKELIFSSIKKRRFPGSELFKSKKKKGYWLFLFVGTIPSRLFLVSVFRAPKVKGKPNATFPSTPHQLLEGIPVSWYMSIMHTQIKF